MKKTRRILLWGIMGLTVFCLTAMGVSALSNLTMPRNTASRDQLAELDKKRLAEAIHLRQTLGDVVWPGLGQMQIPIIIWNKDFSFLVGLNQAPPGWQTIPDDSFLDKSYFRQKSNDPQNFVTAVGDHWAASMATKSETDQFLIDVFRDLLPPLIENIFPYRVLSQPSEVQISAVVHETFHVYQQEKASERLAAAEAAHRRSDAYWGAEPAMRADWEKEIGLLIQAVQEPDDQQAKALASQFLAQRQTRRAQAGLPAELSDYERQIEWEEGLAKYVELAIWEQAFESKAYQPILANDADFKNYRKFPARLKQELAQLKRQASQEGEVRFYYTGMAIARLLDRFSPGWQSGALQEGIWLDDLLGKAVGSGL